MGNFEKLSVVVIVVIIVMILVVAIHEWTGDPSSDATTAATTAQAPIDPLPPTLLTPEPTPAPSAADAGRKPGGDGLIRTEKKLPGKESGKDAGRLGTPGDPLAWQTDPKSLIPDEPPIVPAEGGTADVGAKPADGETKVAATEIAETTHVVVSGDTLGGISKKYYGKASLYGRIVEANPGIGERDLRVNTKLKIPAMKIEATKTLATTPGSSAERAVAGSDAGGDGPVPGKTYKVKSTDTWERISKAAYKTADRWPDIYMSNLKVTASPKDLRANLVLSIPK